MKKYFDNKVIWITGASSGIGEALVYELASKTTANIILSSRKEKELNEVAQNAKLDADRYVILPLDLEDTATLPDAVAQATRAFGKVDIMINNAGISQRSLAIETSLDVDMRLMNINFFGTVALTKAILPHMITAEGGHIVVVSSLMGAFAAPMRSSYAAAKHALHGFFDALRAEMYSKNILITIICPGYVQTNISINALTGDGTPQGTMDDATSRGVAVEECAKKMLVAIANRKNQALIGGREVMGAYLKRFFPLMLAKIIRHRKVV